MRLQPATIRVRLTLWYAVSLASIMTILGAGTYLLLQAQLERQTYERLQERSATLLNLIENNRETRSLLREIEDLEDNEVLPLFRLLRNNNRFYRSSDWARAGLDTTLLATTSDSSWVWEAENGRQYFLLTITDIHNRTRNDFQVAVAEDGEAVLGILQSLTRMLIMAIPIMLILASIGGYLLAGRVLAPVSTLAARAEAITAQRLSDRLPVENPDDEFGRLAIVFNAMLGRLQSSFEQLRRFTSDASHALRTPLTVIRSVGEVGQQESTDLDSCREVVGSMLEETDRLTSTVDALLSLARAEAGLVTGSRESFSLKDLAEEVVDSIGILAEEKHQELNISIDEDVWVSADRSMIRHALINLLDNAIRYTQPKGTIDVRVDVPREGYGSIELNDTGPGIPLDEQTQVFERFHQIAVETREDGTGSGLGLAIAKWAVHLNDGEIELESEPGSGSTFRIILPKTEE
ncbi:ATP-binding protein [Candidatus Zixiibacteriota bacterium]